MPGKFGLPVTGEESLSKLLAALEENPNESNKPLASAIRKTLGMPENKNPLPAPFYPQLKVRPEFPQWRIKYNTSGNEIARRRVNNMDGLWAMH